MTQFGGSWTERKLNILERYLDSYTTALKNQSFRLMYIDAFAGNGIVNIRRTDDDARCFIEGSAERARQVHSKRFDELIFIEQDVTRYAELKSRMDKNRDNRIRVIRKNANDFLQNLDRNWRKHRGVLFLDPFATEVEWDTIEKIASFKALDTWILFPLMAISRMLPVKRTPIDSWHPVLNRVYGSDSWRQLYRQSKQRDLFNMSREERNRGTDELCDLYKKQLREAFGQRFMNRSTTFKNSTNGRLFEFIFCVGSPSANAIDRAKDIARYIIDKSEISLFA